MKKFILQAIRLYQQTLSPDHGWFKHRHPHGYCRYYPSCSEYTHRAIDSYGILKGSVMGLKRILRCNPFSRGGYDPLPQKHNTD